MITRQRKILQALAAAGIAGLALSACSAGGDGGTQDAATETAAEESTDASTGDVPRGVDRTKSHSVCSTDLAVTVGDWLPLQAVRKRPSAPA